MTHVLDALGRIKEYWGSVALSDLDDYAQGRIIRGGAVDWEAYDASTLGAVLIGTGPGVVSTTTPTFVGLTTHNLGIAVGTGRDIDPADASGQDLGDATHRWDLYTQDVIFGGASNANVVTIPTAQAIGFKVVDTNAVEYWRLDTAPQLVSHFNQGAADIDHIFSASGVPNALVVRGSDGWIGNSAAPTWPLDFAYTDATTLRRFLWLENVITWAGAGNFTQTLAYFTTDITHNAAGHITMYGVNSQVNVRGTGSSALNARDVNCYRATGRYYGSGTIDYFAGFALDMRNVGTGTITHLPALHVSAPLNTGGGVITNAYALRIESFAGVAGTNWGVYQIGAGMYNRFHGRVAVGGTALALAQLHVDQSSATGARPTLLLDQADLSEEFIEFTAAVGAGNPIDTAALGAYYGKVRVMVTGVGYKVLALYEES